jgi:hypothetical protein
MKKILVSTLLAAAALAFGFAAPAADPAPAPADKDAALAAKLVGTWEGKWEYSSMSGKAVVVFKSAKGTVLEGTSTWFGTAAGDFNDSFTEAKLKGMKLKVPESTMDFDATLSADGTSMKGTWTSPGGSGAVTLAKKAE